MKPFSRIAAKPAAAIAVALLAAAGMTACGGSHHTGYDDPGTPSTPAPVIDAFFAAVSGIVSTTSDSTEPVSLEANAATAPETNEPESLG